MMKKTMFTLAFISSLFYGLCADAFLASDEFNTNLETCSAYEPPKNAMLEGKIYGIENQKCHISFKGMVVKSELDNRKMIVNECYFPMSIAKAYAQYSREMTKLFLTYINQSSVPQSVENRMTQIGQHQLNIYTNYCN